MANEAVQIEGNYEVHDYTVAEGTGIEQGTLCGLADPRTAAASAAAEPFAGIAATEKVASNGKTELGLWTTGTFDLVCSDAITAGAIVSLSGANLIKTAVAAELLTGAAFGKALETGAFNEAIEVKIGSLE